MFLLDIFEEVDIKKYPVETLPNCKMSVRKHQIHGKFRFLFSLLLVTLAP